MEGWDVNEVLAARINVSEGLSRTLVYVSGTNR